MGRSSHLTAAALGALLCLWPGASWARVDVSIQVTVAGACVGGVAWALSASWSNYFAQTLASSLQLGTPPERPDRRAVDEARPVVFLPLLVVPLP